MKNKIGFLVVAMAVLAMVFATAATAAPYKEDLRGLGSSRDVRLGLHEYDLDKLMKFAEKQDKKQDPRPWFRNVIRGAKGQKAFSHNKYWKAFDVAEVK